MMRHTCPYCGRSDFKKEYGLQRHLSQHAVCSVKHANEIGHQRSLKAARERENAARAQCIAEQDPRRRKRLLQDPNRATRRTGGRGRNVDHRVVEEMEAVVTNQGEEDEDNDDQESNDDAKEDDNWQQLWSFD